MAATASLKTCDKTGSSKPSGRVTISSLGVGASGPTPTRGSLWVQLAVLLWSTLLRSTPQKPAREGFCITGF